MIAHQLESNRMSKESTLLPRQARFVDEYLIDQNAVAAAIRAGYSSRIALVVGARLLKQDEVQKAVEERKRPANSKLNITRDDCIKALVEAYKVARAAQDGGAMVSAIQELNKMCGFYVASPTHAGTSKL